MDPVCGIKIFRLPGRKGPEGPQGPAGPQGPKGDAGSGSVLPTPPETFTEYSTYSIPRGVQSVKIQAWGGDGEHGSKGGYSEGIFPVVSGTTLGVYIGKKAVGTVGGDGGDGGDSKGGDGKSTDNEVHFGGGGGGATDVRIFGEDLIKRVIVAGGGGGGVLTTPYPNTFLILPPTYNEDWPGYSPPLPDTLPLPPPTPPFPVPSGTLSLDTPLPVSWLVGERKFYAINITTPGLYNFYTTGESDSYGILYGTDWTPLASDDDNGDANNFSICYHIPTVGTYYIMTRQYRLKEGQTTLHATFTSPTITKGGDGGGLVGKPGTGTFPGSGGTQTAQGNGYDPGAGSVGGSCNVDATHGGGGGGGYFGGGAGASRPEVSGTGTGGGGSGYISGLGFTVSSDDPAYVLSPLLNGNGCVKISW